MITEVTFALLAWTMCGVASHLGRRYRTQANILPLAIAGAGLAAKGIGGLLNMFGKKKQAKEQAKANEAERFAQQRRAEIGVQAGEDTRLGRLSLAQALLGGLPSQTAGGHVNTNATIDPAVLQSLGARRSYDFSKAFAAPADPSKGATLGFLGGLAGTAGNAALDYGLGKMGGGEAAGAGDNAGGGGGNPLSPEDILKGYGRG